MSTFLPWKTCSYSLFSFHSCHKSYQSFINVPAICMISISILELGFQPTVYACIMLQECHNWSWSAFNMRRLKSVPSHLFSLNLVGVAAFSAGPGGQNHCWWVEAGGHKHQQQGWAAAVHIPGLVCWWTGKRTDFWFVVCVRHTCLFS